MLLRTASLATALACFASAWAGERCSAIDGATLRCGNERVRVDGVKAPALNEPGGEQARKRLQQRVRSGEVVIQRGGKDKWGRTLARVYVNGNRITQVDVSSPRSAQRR
jgi:endonuclease YncB( thermonuclease family)